MMARRNIGHKLAEGEESIEETRLSTVNIAMTSTFARLKCEERDMSAISFISDVYEKRGESSVELHEGYTIEHTTQQASGSFKSRYHFC